jgi:hypothetical protein
VGGKLRLVDASEVLAWARFGTFVPGDQGEEITKKVTSSMADWVFRNFTEFSCGIKSTHGDYRIARWSKMGRRQR